MKPKLIVHGGAWDIPDQFVDDHVAGVKTAIEQVFPLLEQGCSALDAVEKAVNILEADPTFDAGRGAFLNAQGNIELDAFIMDGKALDFGSVAGVANLLHPVSLARHVMRADDFRFLVADGALQFARECGMQEIDPKELLTERELSFYHQIKSDTSFKTVDAFSGDPQPSDTVGAVALDQYGNLACATSTGGTPRKHPGRVGDCPVIGSGGYADNLLGAASSTGYGESLMRVMLCRTACDNLTQHNAMNAAIGAIDYLHRRVEGYGGVIMISPQGEYGFAHNTPRMAYAFADEGGKTHAAIQITDN
ncbi:isoaspartyl peptidase/L-asparaginase [Vibrio ulleungensis]|uniref:Isoaspartyl peptidase/L-asparaginase n=1 Tax=Vibrio ulleungensis TaxID=2807619 RepID=A0ABS2HB80_9VIBR|nr:isoaspartyl peptidase/L-asparaginase [Vibrio ulleungensis]MBM7034858.1 isoaspartyl peptidase/L-asparaginase [Vibrio ulleungensis]